MQTSISPSSPSTATRPEPARTAVHHLERSGIYRDYQKAFETTTGLPLALRSSGSFQSPLHGSKRANAFCTLMAARNKSCAACLQLQQRVETEAATEAKTLQCFAGLNESAIPVRSGDTILGFLQTGQVFFRPPTAARFERIAHQLREWGSTDELPELEAAYFKTRVVPKEHYESIVRLLSIFALHLSSLSNQVMVSEAQAELPAITKARAFIASHQADDLSLAEVARAANMSAFYFCKIFKKATGLTFTDYLARVRTEAVKQMLLNPHMRMSEAAFAAGFQSLSQFNRVFHRIAGESPSRYHERLHHPGTRAGKTFPLAA